MGEKTLEEISKAMRDIDITMLSTYAANGAIASRPMSNNRDVDYEGDSYFFTWENAHMVGEIENNQNVSLSYQGHKHFLIAAEGKAQVIRDKHAFKEHWNADLDKWFENGIDTPGVVMIRVDATRLHYWDGMDEGEIVLS
ncbi:general stress protein 26 [Pseudorhizobium tarimense]|uniref:General stress protein 26 n=1 Tax=Pseudorhizobium tarimense TaxID=1079109 RepID=A0ABV2H4F6_9HYPH|nr:pyridoxamine 5'-phosphate oxidase family protein [Pseudorhizobium tarimense]MCJ8518655.1 pyridoxamine 5'-phosphate oxidase family protein [Pseudorhizobium tarimense]